MALMSQMPKDPRTHQIIGAAMRVHSDLGPGFLEAVYHDCLEIEFAESGIPAAREIALPITYHGKPVKTPYRADFLCFDQVIVELKAKRDLAEADRNQVVHYLKASGRDIGLLLNFGEPKLDFQRFAYNHGI